MSCRWGVAATIFVTAFAWTTGCSDDDAGSAAEKDAGSGDASAPDHAGSAGTRSTRAGSGGSGGASGMGGTGTGGTGTGGSAGTGGDADASMDAGTDGGLDPWVGSGSLSGTVVSSKSAPLPDVTVSAGGATATTDANGEFELSGAQAGERVLVTLEKAGYARGVELVSIVADSTVHGAFVMLAVGAEATFDPSLGGNAQMSNGASVDIPAGAVVDAAGNAVTGSVRLSITPIDPHDPGEFLAFPGEFVGDLQDGTRGLLETVSPMTITLDQDGQLLNLMPGHTAEVLFPANGFTDPTVPLWSLDEATGRWVEEGTAYLTVNGQGQPVYQAQIGHLSSWNCDQVYSGWDPNNPGAKPPQKNACVRFCLKGAPDVIVLNYRDARVPYVAWGWVRGVDYTYGNAWSTNADGCFFADVKANGTIEYWGDASFGESEHKFVTVPPLGAAVRSNPQNCMDLGEVVLEPRIVAVCQGLPGSYPAYCGDPQECVDLLSDERYCGGCDGQCPDEDASCVGGQCVCPPSRKLCPGGGIDGTRGSGFRCLDVANDRYNCGDCNVACQTGERCSDGQCVPIVCGADLTLCGNDCVDTQSSLQHCGGCNQACLRGDTAGAVCDQGACVCSDPALEDCDSDPLITLCRDTQTDRYNCGECGMICPTGQQCQAGTCQAIVCAAPTPDLCGNDCVDTQSDMSNCGGCNQICSDRSTDGAAGNAECKTGTCGCVAGYSDCDPTTAVECHDLQTDRSNCGACGTQCVTGYECVGTCQPLSCSVGTSACGDVCVDLQTDEANCGACGHACPQGFGASTPQCSSGACQCPVTETACIGTGEGGIVCEASTGNCAGAPASSCDDASGDWSIDACGNQSLAHFEQVGCAFEGSNGASGYFSDMSTVVLDAYGTTCTGTLSGDTLTGTCDLGGGQTCPLTASRPACTSPAIVCGSACANVTNDPYNCGFCGNYCGVGAICLASHCSPLQAL